MSDYAPPDAMLSIFNANNYLYNDQPLTIGLANDLYYEQNGRIVQTKNDWGISSPPVISEGAICTRATSGSSTWCLERASLTDDASINFYTGGALSFRMGLNTTPIGVGTGVWSIFNNVNNRVLFLNSGGDLNVIGNVIAAGFTVTPSDRNLKKDISDNLLGLDFIEKIQTKTYRMKIDEDDKPLRYGVIYQEVEELLNQDNISFGGLVETEYVKGVAYLEFIAPLIKSVQELSARVKELEAKINT